MMHHNRTARTHALERFVHLETFFVTTLMVTIKAINSSGLLKRLVGPGPYQ